MRELAISIGQEVNQTLAAIVENADRGLQSLNQSAPDIGQLREALTNIAGDGRHTIEIIARIREHTNRPLAVGFGVATREHFKAVAR